MNIIDVVIDGSMKATASLMKNYPKLQGCEEMICDCLKQNLKTKLAYLQNEWRNAVEANLGEGWMREMVNAQCWEIAKETLEICNAEI
jgi:predicted thioredoxin/glutaredoxin